MFDSQALEVAVGLVLVFLLVSLVLTAIRESIESVTRTRALDLEHALAELLDDPDGTGLRKAFYSHPLVFALFPGSARLSSFSVAGNQLKGAGGIASSMELGAEALNELGKSSRKNLPSYIPRDIFSAVLEDLIRKGNITGRLRDAYGALLQSSGGDVLAARKGLESWYDAAMDRASGWYRRRSQYIVGILGVVLAIALNINAVTVARYLATNSAARAQAITLAGKVDASTLPTSSSDRVTAFQNLVAPLELPIGWNGDQVASMKKRLQTSNLDLAGEVLLLIAGYLIVGFAATLGAPFWFDMLGKIMVVRSTVKPKEKSPDEASKDAAPEVPKATARSVRDRPGAPHSDAPVGR